VLDRFRTIIVKGSPPSGKDKAYEALFRKNCIEAPDSEAWTQGDLIRFLAESNPGVAPEIIAAGPLLYRSALFLSVFPFYPDRETKLTSDALHQVARLMVRDGNFSLPLESARGVVARKRKEIDYHRLLFSSFAYVDPGKENTIGESPVPKNNTISEKSTITTSRDLSTTPAQSEFVENLTDVIAAIYAQLDEMHHYTFIAPIREDTHTVAEQIASRYEASQLGVAHGDDTSHVIRISRTVDRVPLTSESRQDIEELVAECLRLELPLPTVEKLREIVVDWELFKDGVSEKTRLSNSPVSDEIVYLVNLQTRVIYFAPSERYVSRC
jgi:hypothetical protein